MSSMNWLDLVGDDSNLSMKSVDFKKCEEHILNNNSRSIFDPELDSSQQGLPLLFRKTKLIDETSNQSQLGKRSRSRMNEMDNSQDIEIGDNAMNANNDSNNKESSVDMPPKAKQRTDKEGHWKRKKTNMTNGFAADFSRFLPNSNSKNEDISLSSQSNQTSFGSIAEANKENDKMKTSFANILQASKQNKNGMNNNFNIGFGSFLKPSTSETFGFASKETSSSASVLSTGFTGNLITPSSSCTPNKVGFAALNKSSTHRRPVHTRRRRVAKFQRNQQQPPPPQTQKPSNAATAPSVSSTLPSPALATQDVKPSDDAPDPMPATDDGGTGRASDSNDVKIGVTDAQELKTPPPSAVAATAPVAAKEPNEAAHGPKTPKTSEAAVELEAKGQGQDLASTRATTAEASEDEDIDVKPDGIKLELLQPRETTQILQEDGTRMSMAYDDNIGADCDKIDAVSSNVTSVSNVAAALGGPALISVIPGTSYFPVAAMPVGDLNNQTPISSFIGGTSFGFSPFSMSNAIDLATLSTEDGNNDSKEDDACGTASASPQSGGTNKASNDIPMATPHNTTSISFSHLGSLSAKKKSSLSPMPPNLLPQLSTFSAGTQGSLFDVSLGSFASIAPLGSVSGMHRSRSFPLQSPFAFSNQIPCHNFENKHNNSMQADPKNASKPAAVPVLIPAFFPSPPAVVTSRNSNKVLKNNLNSCNLNNNNNNDNNNSNISSNSSSTSNNGNNMNNSNYQGPTLTTTLVNSMISQQSGQMSLPSCSATNVSITSSQPVTNSTNANIDDDSGNSNDNQSSRSHNSMIDTSSFCLTHNNMNITLNNNNNIIQNTHNKGPITGQTPTHGSQTKKVQLHQQLQQQEQSVRLTKSNSQVSSDLSSDPTETSNFVWGHSKASKSAEKQMSANSWANKLFPEQVKQNAEDKVKEEALAVEQRKQEILIEKANRSILPSKRRNEMTFNYSEDKNGFQFMSPKKGVKNKNGPNRRFSYNFDVNQNENNFYHQQHSSRPHSNRTTPRHNHHHQQRFDSRGSHSARKQANSGNYVHRGGWGKKGMDENGSSRCASMTPENRSKSVSIVSTGPVEVTETAIAWREKQIAMGKDTNGYKNYIKMVEKEWRRPEDPQTPDPRERIGKKRFVGKLQKWRHLLHKFDDEDAASGSGKVNLNAKMMDASESVSQNGSEKSEPSQANQTMDQSK